jgi:hypothetical protein
MTERRGLRRLLDQAIDRAVNGLAAPPARRGDNPGQQTEYDLECQYTHDQYM